VQKLYIIKVGGNIIDNPEALNSFLKDFASLKENKILVHGGGKVATEISKGLGIEAQMVDGRRITDAETLKIVTMVYGGLINKNIVAKLQANNCNAIGLTGADANIMLSDKRPLKNGIDYGFVGDVKKVKSQPLVHLLSQGITTVVAPLTHDGNGNMLNTNADTVASELAVALSENFVVNLVYCFELKGVLSDFEDKDSVINEINPATYEELKSSGVINKGMIPKLDNSFAAIHAGVSSVIICQAEALVELINDKKAVGTKLVSSH
jgi:acetylglutamate kinase